MIKPVEGTVEGAMVRLTHGGGLADGQRVVVVAIPPYPPGPEISPEMEEEDVAFVRVCRGRLARQLNSADQEDDD